jgi:hypothetical protein
MHARAARAFRVHFRRPAEYLSARLPREHVSMRILVSLRDAVLRNQPRRMITI